MLGAVLVFVFFFFFLAFLEVATGLSPPVAPLGVGALAGAIKEAGADSSTVGLETVALVTGPAFLVDVVCAFVPALQLRASRT